MSVANQRHVSDVRSFVYFHSVFTPGGVSRRDVITIEAEPRVEASVPGHFFNIMNRHAGNGATSVLTGALRHAPGAESRAGPADHRQPGSGGRRSHGFERPSSHQSGRRRFRSTRYMFQAIARDPLAPHKYQMAWQCTDLELVK